MSKRIDYRAHDRLEVQIERSRQNIAGWEHVARVFERRVRDLPPGRRRDAAREDGRGVRILTAKLQGDHAALRSRLKSLQAATGRR